MNSMNGDERGRPVAAVNPAQVEDKGWVTARAGGAAFRTALTVRGFEVIADEPAVAGGSDAGPTPYELLLGALAAFAWSRIRDRCWARVTARRRSRLSASATLRSRAYARSPTRLTAPL